MSTKSSSSTSTSTSTTNSTPRIKLHDNARSRKNFDELADLYAIFKATQHLEVAYSRDAISKEAYTEACSKLISQYKTAQHALVDSPHEDVVAFLTHYKASGDCTRAMRRLIQEGVPATVMHQDHSTRTDGNGVLVAETVSNFITVIDALRLSVRTVDDLTMSMLDLMASLNRTVGMPDDFAPKLKGKRG
jgi:ESCRT-I complex subunit VPS28